MRKGNGDEESLLFSSPSGVLAENENDSGALLPENRLLLTEFQHMLLNAVPLRYLSDVKMNTAEKTPDFHLSGFEYKKLSYRRVTARCVLSVVILPITTQQCRNYLYDKS